MRAIKTMNQQKQNYHLKTDSSLIHRGTYMLSTYIFVLDYVVVKSQKLVSRKQASLLVHFITIEK